MGDPGKLVLLEGVLEVVKRDNLLAQVQRSGERLLTGLKTLQNEFPALVGQARGRGTFLAISCANSKLRDDMVNRLKLKGELSNPGNISEDTQNNNNNNNLFLKFYLRYNMKSKQAHIAHANSGSGC